MVGGTYAVRWLFGKIPNPSKRQGAPKKFEGKIQTPFPFSFFASTHIVIHVEHLFTMSAPPSVVGKVDQGPTLLGVSWAFTVVATIFVALRYHCRINYQLRLWWDDAWMLIALVSLK